LPLPTIPFNDPLSIDILNATIGSIQKIKRKKKIQYNKVAQYFVLNIKQTGYMYIYIYYVMYKSKYMLSVLFK